MIGPWVDRIAAFRPGDTPLGKGFLYAVAMGLVDAAIAGLSKVSKDAIPGWASGLGTAIAVRKVGAIKGFLGDTGSEVVAVAGVRSAIDRVKTIEGLSFSSWLTAKITGVLGAPMGTPGLSASAPEEFAAPTADELAAAQEYLTSVERKIKAIAGG